MAYPSTITSFTNPSPTDKLSTTPHSSIETAQNTDLTAIETFVGTLSSNVGTLIYDIRAAASNGGGHVQTANKGGTGQTAYTKGDILVATSSSALTKLAVSANDNDQLVVDSSVAAGVKWFAGVTSGQIQNMAFQHAFDGGTASVYSISPVPCVLSYANGQIFTFRAANANTITGPRLIVSSLASKLIKNPDGTALKVSQIAASALTMVQYDGNASVFQLMSQKNGAAVSSFANGTATRAGDATSGAQTIAHGLSATPSYVRITGTKNISAGNNVGGCTSFGAYNGTTTSCVFYSVGLQGTNGGNAATDGTNVIVIQDNGSGTSQVATIGVDGTNITLTWTKAGSPNANGINILWEAWV